MKFKQVSTAALKGAFVLAATTSLLTSPADAQGKIGAWETREFDGECWITAYGSDDDEDDVFSYGIKPKGKTRHFVTTELESEYPDRSWPVSLKFDTGGLRVAARAKPSGALEGMDQTAQIAKAVRRSTTLLVGVDGETIIEAIDLSGAGKAMDWVESCSGASSTR